MMFHNPGHPQRYGRARGMKVKHLLQLVVFTVLLTWFLYQVNVSYKAKVLTRRAAERDFVDRDLLISNDKGGFIRDGVPLAEEFIDKQSVQRLQKNLPDGPERDTDGGSDGPVATPTAEEAKEGGGAREKVGVVEEQSERATEPTDDRGDGEDEVAEDGTGKEFDSVALNHTETTAEDDPVVYTSSEEMEAKGVDMTLEEEEERELRATASARSPTVAGS